MTRSKQDVQFHGTTAMGYNPKPAINVKVHGWYRDVKFDEIASYYGDDSDVGTFTDDWFDRLSESEKQSLWEWACNDAYEQFCEEVEEIFPDTKWYSEGRSGGWLYSPDLPDFDSWDAIMLGKWWKVEKLARMYVEDVPYQMVVSAFLNFYESRKLDVAFDMALRCARV